MKISVLTPVYRDPERVGDIVEKVLANTWEDKEMIVAVDGPTNSAIEAALEPFRDRITVFYSSCQNGKAATINSIALSHSTDVFLMLDNDIELPEDSQYLEKLADRMGEYDLVEIPKEAIRKTSVSRMMAFEFLSFAMTSVTMARIGRQSPSMNGAAFAVKAELFRRLGGFAAVMNEDMDFAARAFRQNASFGYPSELKVRNDVPNTVHDWLIQRKRWAMNNVLWLRKNFRLLLVNLFKSPALIISSLLMLLPFLTYLAVYFLAKQTHLSLLLPLIFMISQHFHVISGFLLWPAHLELISGGSWIATLMGLVVAGLVFFVFSRSLGFHFNGIDFFFYYFLYSPIWLFSNIIMFIVVLFRIDVDIEWKVAQG